MQLGFKARLFLILFVAGMSGVLSFLLVDLSAFLALIPKSADIEIPQVTWSLKLLSLIQPSVLTALAVLIGVFLAQKVNLHAPASEALASGSEVWPALRLQIIPGLIGGAVGALLIVSIAAIFRPFFPPQVVERIAKFAGILPMPTRLLYGGILEEVLLRWGFMTLLVWLLVWIAWRFLQKRNKTPSKVVLIMSIFISAFVFGLGHLGIAFLLIPEHSLSVTLFVIIANSAFGIVAGFLYWRKGLESAIIAHMCCHIWLYAASLTGIY